MDALFHPSYFPSVSHFVAMAQADHIVLEMDDHFQKQSNRNRMYIYSPNGVQLLNIPIKHAEGRHQKTKDVRIENAFNWQKQHFKSLEAAYRNSPFFEYFEDELLPIFEKKHEFLMDLNLHTMELAAKFLGMPFQVRYTEEYFKIAVQTDFRNLVDGKKDASQFEPYCQVFEEKFGYINNLSILDLVFNEGRHALRYLQNQKI